MNSPPFPSLRSIERGAALALVLGTLTMTATFGLRTAVFQPDYFAEPVQAVVLAGQAAFELFFALILGFLVVWVRRPSVAKTVLVVSALLLTALKGFLLAFFAVIGEVPSPSPGTVVLCTLVTIPLWLTYLPVLSAIASARGAHILPVADPESTSQNTPPAHDSPFEIRAAVCAWLATVGLGAFLLGPDWLVRLWASLSLGGAAAHLAIGLAEEKRLSQWASQAIAQGPPSYQLGEEEPLPGIPALFAEHARKATLFGLSEQAGSYRQEPRKEPLAALDPAALKRPRSFARRVTRRLPVPMVYTILAVAISWPLLHPSDLPPRAVSLAFAHERIVPYTSYSIEGLTLWSVRRGAGKVIVGYDPEAHATVGGEQLFLRFRSVSKGDLAELANATMYGGEMYVLRGSDPGWPKDEKGESPKAPFVQGDKLFFWRSAEGKSLSTDVPIVPGMVGPDDGK